MFDGDKLISFVDGFVTDEPDLTDAMYEDAGELIQKLIDDSKAQGRKGVVLTCKDKLVNYYAKFGFVNEGVSNSVHGGVVWYQMRLTF